MDKIQEIHQTTKKHFIIVSMENNANQEPDVRKAIQSIAICLLFLENNMTEKYAIRDCRNLIYDMSKGLKNKDAKKILKGLLKIIK